MTSHQSGFDHQDERYRILPHDDRFLAGAEGVVIDWIETDQKPIVTLRLDSAEEWITDLSGLERITPS